MQNISENILNRVISKNIQADLRKFKLSAGQRNRGDRGTSNGRERTRSPNRRERQAPVYPEEEVQEVDPASLSELSKEVSHYLSSLNTSS